MDSFSLPKFYINIEFAMMMTVKKHKPSSQYGFVFSMHNVVHEMIFAPDGDSGANIEVKLVKNHSSKGDHVLGKGDQSNSYRQKREDSMRDPQKSSVL